MRLHELAVSHTGGRIAGGYSDGMVRVWDLKSRPAVAEFPTVFAFGGRRLAIDSAGNRVLAAAWGRGGLRCYAVRDGAEVWRTSRAHAIQWVSLSSDETRVYCGQDRGPLVVLDANTGNECAPPLKGVDALWESPDGRVQVRRMGRRPWFHITASDGALLARVPSVGRGVVSAAFRNDAVWVAENGDSANLRCFDPASGAERWRYESPHGAHVARLSPGPGRSSGVLALEHFFDGTTRERLLHFSARAGKVRRVALVQRAWEWQFAAGGRILVTSNGAAIETAGGKRVRGFEFENADSDIGASV